MRNPTRKPIFSSRFAKFVTTGGYRHGWSEDAERLEAKLAAATEYAKRIAARWRIANST